MNSENEKSDQVYPDPNALSSAVSRRPDRWLENEEIKLLRETVERQRKIISELNETISEQKETIVSITLENERRTQILIRSLKRTHEFVDLLARFDDLLTAQKADHAENPANKRQNPNEPKNIEIEEEAPMELEILMAENSESSQENVPKPFTKPLETILIEKSIQQKSIREKSLPEKSKLPKPDFSGPEKGPPESPEFDTQKEEKYDIRKSPDQEKLNRPKTRKRSKSIESKELEKSKLDKVRLEKPKREKPKMEKSKLEKSKAKPIKEKSRPKKSKLKIKDVTIIDDRILQVEAAAYERENMKVETESEDDFVEIHLPPKKKRKINRRFGIKN